MWVRIFKDPEFEAWAAKSGITDIRLCTAASEIEAGLIDARLGGFLIKKRVAAEGRGKRSGYRTILGYREGARLIFVHGFAKNESVNITRKEKEALRKLCEVYMLASDDRLAEMVRMKVLLEVHCREQIA